MVLRTLRRLLLAAVAAVVCLASGAAVVTWLALQEPGFYAELRTAQPSPDQSDAVVREITQMKADFVHWRDRSHARRPTPAPNAPAAVPADGRSYDAESDTIVLRITEQQLNGILASDAFKLSGDLSNPRVRLKGGRIELGAELSTPHARCIVSAGLKPSLTDTGALRLDIESIRVGRVTIPFRWLLARLPQAIVLSGRDAEIDLTPPTPHIQFKSLSRGVKAPTVQSVTCDEGMIVVELATPVQSRS
ncbi:hypothetical protein Pla175_26050 [Pirellulimonas nuda]|uniref:DUF2993 domain-containing protein n=2 Tax=Pirellulimonas nuda TaxID=2528009 RepID=A0A518DCL4_9BACT|nr:hypothetical protein Pla175_26050 [Pirellulimonas nuda]